MAGRRGGSRHRDTRAFRDDPGDGRGRCGKTTSVLVHLRRPSRLSTLDLADTQPFVDPAGRFASATTATSVTRPPGRRTAGPGRIHGRADTEVGARWLEDAWRDDAPGAHLRPPCTSDSGARRTCVLAADGTPYAYAGNSENPVFTFELDGIGIATTGIYSTDRSVFRYAASGATEGGWCDNGRPSPWTVTGARSGVLARNTRALGARYPHEQGRSETARPPRPAIRQAHPSLAAPQLFRLSVYWFGINAIWGGIRSHPPGARSRPRRRRHRRSRARDRQGQRGDHRDPGPAHVGAISDYTISRWGRRKPYIAIGATLDVVFLIGIAISQTYLSVIAFVILLQFSSNFAQGPFQGFVPDLVPAKQVGLASGLGVMYGARRHRWPGARLDRPLGTGPISRSRRSRSG